MRARRRDREHVNGPADGSGNDRSGGATGGGTQGGGNRSRSNRNRNRNRKRNRGGGGGSSSGGGGGGGNQRSGQAASGAGFWGDASKLPAPTRDVRITDDPAAVARSLGSPPLPGHEKIAEHYFRVVYERAVQTAGALAAAGGLIDPETLTAELGE